MSKKPASQPKKVGRPSIYSTQLALTICEAMASGKSLKQVCEQDGMPAYSTVRKWELENAEFAALSTRAREIGCHVMAEECIEIADDGRNDWMLANDEENAGYKFNGEHAQRSKLRIETRMRLIGKWMPKVYGDKMALTDGDGKPLQAAAPVLNVEVKG